MISEEKVKPNFNELGDDAFGGDLSIFCDLSECETPIDAFNQVEALIADLRRVSAFFSEMGKKPPDTSFTNYERWLREGATSMTYESWVAWRNAGNGED